MTLKSSTLVLIAAAAGAATTAACSDNDLVLPQPPQDLTATVQAYETPTGTIDFAHLEQVAADARADLASRNLDWLPGLVSDALVAVRRRFDDGGYPVDPSIPRKQNRAKVDAVVQVQHLCGGWTGQPTGNVDLTAVISDTELEHAVWGNAANCQARVDVDTSLGLNVVPTVNGFFDGTVAVFLEGSLPETDRQGQLVVAVSGEIGVQDHTASGSFDFRITGGQIETRHAVADGDIIVAAGLGSVSLRGSNGTATCNLEGLQCSAAPTSPATPVGP